MPNYEYKCSNCGHKTTVFQKITEEKLKTCSKCLEDSLQRLIGGGMATLRFEGKGYYITDYGQKNTTSSSCDSCPAASKKSTSPCDKS